MPNSQRRLLSLRPHQHLAVLLPVLALFLSVHAYDSLDPTGNVTIVWDIIVATKTTYTVNVTIQNLQQFQTVSNWSLSWTWPGKEYILDPPRGAEATQQGDCKALILNNNTSPHCCLKTPTMVDLQPLVPPPFPGCCRGGYLDSLLRKPNESVSVFQMDVANTEMDSEGAILPPIGPSLGVPGYTCSPAIIVQPNIHFAPGSRRAVPSFQTFNIICTYRKPETKPPKCCVSFSAFYSTSIVPCPSCACACGSFAKSAALCLLGEDPEAGIPFLVDGSNVPGVSNLPNSVVCSPDGCPVHIRYHVKDNYEGFWRAKVTVFNRRFQQNYSDWRILMQHPNVGSITQLFSFNSTFIQPYGVNNTAAFSGIQGYNEWLLPADNKTGPGIVQSEILYQKVDDFTLSDGWAFPRKVVFNGEDCAMPNDFPPLPNAAQSNLSPEGAVQAASALLFAALILLFS